MNEFSEYTIRDKIQIKLKIIVNKKIIEIFFDAKREYILYTYFQNQQK